MIVLPPRGFPPSRREGAFSIGGAAVEDVPNVIYFSSVSNNTHRFVEKLDFPSRRLPLRTPEETIVATGPFVLITPTYGGGDGNGAVPKQVIKFLNVPENRALIKAVIAAGNTNFGPAYGLAGDVVAHKCNVPLLYRFELFGTTEDVRNVSLRMEKLWMMD